MNLAFDDGPLATTSAILDVLGEHDQHATFFVVGERIAERWDLLVRMAREGHEIGNHGWMHEPHDAMGFDEVVHSIVQTQLQVQQACGVRPTVFRPPFMRWSPTVERAADALGLELCLGSSIGDYQLEDPAEIAARAKGLEFVGMHDGHWPTVDALRLILGDPEWRLEVAEAAVA